MTEFRKKPPRLSMIFSSYDPPLYFVSFCTWKRQRILNTESVHFAFRKHAENISTMGLAVGRYVLMPDHIHFFVRIGPGRKLSTMIRLLKQDLSKKIEGTKAGERIWQPGFFDHLLRNSESYSEKWHYVWENPVRAGLVTKADDWPYQGEIVRIDRV